MRKTTLFLALGLAVLAGEAAAQANLRPDPTTRLPPQPGQGLPVEDMQFLTAAQRISRLEGDLAKLAAERGGPEVKALAAKLGGDHQRLEGDVRKLVQERGASGSSAPPTNPKEGGPGGAAGAVTNPANAAPRGEQALKELSGVSGEEFDRRWVQEQLAVHDRLVDLYQTQASHSPDTELAKFAIITLAGIQEHRGALRELGKRYGLKAETTGQAWQY